MKFLTLEFELPLFSFLFLLILNIVFFTKKKIPLIENKIYGCILFFSLVESILDTILHINGAMNNYDVIMNKYYEFANIMNKFVVEMFIIVFSCLLTYILIISFEKYREKSKKLILVFCLVDFLTFLVLLFTNIKVIKIGSVTNVSGSTIIFGYSVVAILLFLSLIVSILSLKKFDKRYLPIFCMLVLLIGAYILTILFPGIIIYDLILALLCYIMYFTIENPDLKMVNELLRNKELVEKGMEDKSRFLFEVTGDIKKPTKNIISLSNNYNKFNEEEKEKAIKIIKSNANSILFKLNKELDISSLDASKIKVFNNEYDVYILFKSIQEITENLIKSKNVDLKFYVDKNLPTKLYGDEVRLKQIIMSVLSNSVQNTNKGFISVDVSAIVRYDVARLIIKIEDSGCGMSIDKINTILDDNRDLTKEETQKLDKLDMDLVATIKSLKLLGGSFNVRSEENKGSTFTIVIDQKCNTKQETKLMKSAMKYSSDVFGKKRILIVDDDKEELFKISNILSKYNVDINTTLSGKDCILRVQAGEIYNLIIIDDELKNESALGTLEELTKIKNFNSKVIVLLSKDKEHLKKYYIKDGFTDVILKENLTDELKEKTELNL